MDSRSKRHRVCRKPYPIPFPLLSNTDLTISLYPPRSCTPRRRRRKLLLPNPHRWRWTDWSEPWHDVRRPCFPLPPTGCMFRMLWNGYLLCLSVSHTHRYRLQYCHPFRQSLLHQQRWSNFRMLPPVLRLQFAGQRHYSFRVFLHLLYTL